MTKPDPSTAEDDDIARLLRAAGPREQLPADMKQRWEQQFRAELAPVLAPRRQDRRRFVMGLCASLAVVAAAISYTLLPGPRTEVLIRVSHASGDQLLRLPGRSPQQLRAGEQLQADSVINTGADGQVALVYGGYDLRLNHDTRLMLKNDRIVLETGELYASDYSGNQAPKQRDYELRVDTPLGSIRDIGTQFTVAVFPDRTVTTVRRGAVLINTDDTEVRAEPQSGAASRLTIDRQHQVHTEAAEPSGNEWRWIYSSASRFELEGRTAYEFLQWSVGESGLQLEFAGEGAEIHARTVLLHGNIDALDPEQAVAPVLASTDLVATRIGVNTLVISLNPERR
jgi:ferric-dicitrate binding protein FerR (iron transport regulator)